MVDKALAPDKSLVAFCGLYCGECRAYKKGKCPGCAGNSKATWCKIRECNAERGYSTCAECTEFADVRECRKFHNVMSRFFSFVFNSNRPACIARVKELGLEEYAAYMVKLGRQSIPQR